MKKFILKIYLLLFTGLLVNAQTQSGNILLGGAIGWEKSENATLTLNTPKTALHELRIQPITAIFLKDNLATGLFFNYQSTREYNLYINSKELWTKSTLLTLGPFVRKYIPVSSLFSFYGQGMLGYTASKDLDYRGVSFAFKPGLTFFATPKLGVDLSVQGLSYNIIRVRDLDKTGNELNLDINLPALNFGFNFYLTR